MITNASIIKFALFSDVVNMSGMYCHHVPAYISHKIAREGEIEERIAELQEELKGLQTELTNLRAQLLPFRLQPSVDLPPRTPIIKCPNEILYSIFKFTIEDYHPRIRRLLLVCRRWNSIIMTSPRFWTEISINDVSDPNFLDATYSHNYINACLERSQGLSLHIDLDMSFYDWHEGYIRDEIDKCARQFLEPADQILFSHQLWSLELDYYSSKYAMCVDEAFDRLLGNQKENIIRWGSLNICFPENLSAPLEFWGRFDAPAPNLRSLEFRGAPPYLEMFGEDDWIKYGLKNLANVDQFRSTTDISLLLLGLSPLSLQRLTSFVNPYFQNFRELNAFTNLHSLILECHKPSTRILPPLWELTLDLPRLTELVIGGDYVILRHVKFILSSLNTLIIKTGRRFHPLPTLTPKHIRWDFTSQTSRHRNTFFAALGSIFQLSTLTETIMVDKCLRSSVIRVAGHFWDKGLLPGLTHIIIGGDGNNVESIDIRDAGLLMEQMGLERLLSVPDACNDSIYLSEYSVSSDDSDDPDDL